MMTIRGVLKTPRASKLKLSRVLSRLPGFDYTARSVRSSSDQRLLKRFSDGANPALKRATEEPQRSLNLQIHYTGPDSHLPAIRNSCLRARQMAATHCSEYGAAAPALSESAEGPRDANISVSVAPGRMARHLELMATNAPPRDAELAFIRRGPAASATGVGGGAHVAGDISGAKYHRRFVPLDLPFDPSRLKYTLLEGLCEMLQH
ncbi:hypothetical protein B0H17DRAFT_560799 [Mycena rosella]|uniref:Uncharacterized protein n=1 Tax=Mycena rosella TaxID=1033263 RepID=A0AAD7FM12_MYCRO|nr:hypothetical protein B0H17DRAFT_560799 [Mycena rosella]